MNKKELIHAMDEFAQRFYGEFGFATCSSNEQIEIVQAIIEDVKSK